jgi:DNA processing protein
VAGLSDATVVVEARARSGALITADLALDEGREVLAVPGEITSALSAGSNGLLRLGATPATSAADVLEVLGVEPDAREARASAVDDLPLAAGAVLSHVGAAAVSADELVRLTELDASVVSAALVELELRGLVEHHDGVFRGVMPL